MADNRDAASSRQPIGARPSARGLSAEVGRCTQPSIMDAKSRGLPRCKPGLPRDTASSPRSPRKTEANYYSRNCRCGFPLVGSPEPLVAGQQRASTNLQRPRHAVRLPTTLDPTRLIDGKRARPPFVSGWRAGCLPGRPLQHCDTGGGWSWTTTPVHDGPSSGTS